MHSAPLQTFLNSSVRLKSVGEAGSLVSPADALSLYTAKLFTYMCIVHKDQYDLWAEATSRNIPSHPFQTLPPAFPLEILNHRSSLGGLTWASYLLHGLFSLFLVRIKLGWEKVWINGHLVGFECVSLNVTWRKLSALICVSLTFGSGVYLWVDWIEEEGRGVISCFSVAMIKDQDQGFIWASNPRGRVPPDPGAAAGGDCSRI